MKLNDASLRDPHQWTAAGFVLPAFNREVVIKNTHEKPAWIHFGSGNIFRAHLASLQQKLLDLGKTDTGIIVVGGHDFEVITKSYRPYDNLSVLVTLKADGQVDKKVLGSVTESLIADSTRTEWKRLQEIFSNSSLQMASFTITEKGYSLTGADGSYTADVLHDLESGPVAPKNVIAKTASLCFERYKNGAAPLALVSMDNCSHNGTKLKNAMLVIVSAWQKAGFVDAAFIEYVNSPNKLSFPWTMIDKITPRPDASVKALLEKAGYESANIAVTEKGAWTASFVNAEEAEYLVIEDLFPNGRPPLENAGVLFTERNTVDLVEKMKVCTGLNPLHTSLAIFGCLLGFKTIHDEMHDHELKALVEKIGYIEGLPVVAHPGIINPEDFIREVITVRFPNPFMTDTPQRIATDTSQKLSIRFGETIKAYMAHPDLDASKLVYIPLVLAGWCRYLLAIDDEGNVFIPSPDPRLEVSRKFLAGISLGDKGPFHAPLEVLLSDATFFGVNLYEAGLGEKVEAYFAELVAGKGAVRATLKKYLK